MKILSKLNCIEENILSYSRKVLLDYDNFFSNGFVLIFLGGFILPIIYFVKSFIKILNGVKE